MGTNAGISSTTGGTPDTQFFHLRLKGGAFEAENLGGTTAARKAPAAFLQGPQDVPAFGLLKAQIFRNFGR